MNNPLDDAINSGAGHSVPRVRSLPNSEHDPLCYMSEGKWDGGCRCLLIARVRADERERAVQRTTLAFALIAGMEPLDVAIFAIRDIFAIRGEVTDE